MRTVVQEMQMQYTVYLSQQPSSHKIWACPDNTATLLIQPNVFDPLVGGVPLYTFIYTVG